MKPIGSLYLAQAKEFLREPMTLLFVLLLPVAFGVFFGLIFSGSGNFILSLGVVNEDTGPVGVRIVEWLRSPDVIQMLNFNTGSRGEMLAKLNKGELSVVVVLPADLSAAAATGTPTEVEVFYDPTRQISAGVGLGMVRTLLNDANLALTSSPRLLVLKEQTVQARAPRQIEFYLPGMLGIALLWLGVFGTAQPVVAQREAQVLRRLSITPITAGTILTAEVGWRVTVGLLQAATFLIVGYIGFQIGVKDWPLFLAGLLLGTLVFVGWGYVMAGLARTTESAMAIAQLINFPMMMLSGSIFPAEMLPGSFQPIVKLMPLTYLSDLFRQTMTGLPSMHSMTLNFAVLGGWLVVGLILAARLWRWE